MFKKKNYLTTLVIAGALLFSSGNVYANSSVDDIKEKVSETEEKKEHLKGELEKVQEEVSSVRDKMMKISKEIEKTKTDIAETQANIEKTEVKIEETKKNIKITEAELKVKKEALAHNLRKMYSKGDVSFMEYLFRADDVSEFLGRFDSIKRIARANEVLYQEVREKTEQLKAEKKSLDEEKTRQVTQKNELVTLKATQEAKKAEEMKLLVEMVEKEKTIEHEINAQDAAIESMNNEIAEIIRQREIERKKREEEAKRKQQAGQAPSAPTFIEPVGSGKMIIPVPAGQYYISSGFGYRIHPVYGTRKLHNGIDFAAPYNTPILAADSGTVIFSGPASGYGNWIVIDHNNGYYTTYGHMEGSQLRVYAGQTVQRGEHIAGIASAGTSTGNHLHFVVSYGSFNSNYIDPMTMF